MLIPFPFPRDEGDFSAQALSGLQVGEWSTLGEAGVGSKIISNMSFFSPNLLLKYKWIYLIFIIIF